jgi:hypothetical protein
LLGIAILLFVTPEAFYAGEKTECLAHYQAVSKIVTAQVDSGAVAFDTCGMVDFGIFPWMRYTFLLAIAILIASAFSYRKDRRCHLASVPSGV